MDWSFQPFPDNYETEPVPYVPVIVKRPKRRLSGNSARKREYVRPDEGDLEAFALWSASTPPTKAARIAEELVRWYGAVCHLCHEPIDMELRGHHPGRWNVEHVIPRAKSGTQNWGNLKLAHRGCNSEKSDLALPEPPPWLYAELCRASIARFENDGRPARNKLERARYEAVFIVADLAMMEKGIELAREHGIIEFGGFPLLHQKAQTKRAIAKVRRLQNRVIAERDARAQR